MTSLWRSLRNHYACGRKFCMRTDARSGLKKPWKCEVSRANREAQDRGSASHVSGALQLRRDVRGHGKLRPSRDRLEPIPDLSGLLQVGYHREGYWQVDKC